MTKPILKSPKEMKDDIRFFAMLIFIFIFPFIWFVSIKHVIHTLLFSTMILFLFIHLRHLQNRRHNNIQYLELNYQLNEIRKSVKLKEIRYKLLTNGMYGKQGIKHKDECSLYPEQKRDRPK